LEAPTDWQQHHRPPHGAGAGDVGAGELPGEERLPSAYGRDRLTLLVRDPHCVFAFWELTETTRAEGPARSAETVLRLYDLTEHARRAAERSLAATDGRLSPSVRATWLAAWVRAAAWEPPAWIASAAHRYVDYVVGGADNWYIHTDAPGQVLAAALGFGRGEAFVPVVFSNVVFTPRGAPCDAVDADWLTVEELYRVLARSTTGMASAAWHAAKSAQDAFR